MNIDWNDLETKDLIEELKDRGHSVDKNLSDFDALDLESELRIRGYAVYDCIVELEDFENSEIVTHLEIEGYTVLEGESIEDHLSNLPSYKLRDLFCDMVGVNHHTEKDELMKLLSEKIK